MNTGIDTLIPTIMSICTRTRNIAMNTPIHTSMNTRTSTVMNMSIKGSPTYMHTSMLANTDLTTINTRDTRKRYTCISINR